MANPTNSNKKTLKLKSGLKAGPVLSPTLSIRPILTRPGLPGGGLINGIPGPILHF